MSSVFSHYHLGGSGRRGFDHETIHLWYGTGRLGVAVGHESGSWIWGNKSSHLLQKQKLARNGLYVLTPPLTVDSSPAYTLQKIFKRWNKRLQHRFSNNRRCLMFGGCSKNVASMIANSVIDFYLSLIWFHRSSAISSVPNHTHFAVSTACCYSLLFGLFGCQVLSRPAAIKISPFTVSHPSPNIL